MVEFGFLMRARSGKQCFARKNLLVAGGVAPQTTSRFLNGLTPFRNDNKVSG
jgi:hypothetical protein